MNVAELIKSLDPAEVQDLLDEVGEKNVVRVTKHTASHAARSAYKTYKKTFDDEFRNAVCTIPSLLKIDQLRIAKGAKPMFLDAAIRRISGGELMSVSFNLRTNVGIDLVAIQLGGTGLTTTADYLAVSNNTTAPNATHTSSTIPWSSAQATDAAAGSTTGEYTALGVARAQATYAHTNGVASYTETKTFTATGTITSLQVAGLFGGSTRTAQAASGTNVLFVENTFTATSMVNTDQLTLTWTINI
jgi:hypothetical protein